MKLLRGVCVALAYMAAPINYAHAEYVTLEQTWVDAYQHNPSLEAARAKLRATDEQVAVALSHWHPSVDATSSVGKTYQRIPDQQAFDTANYSTNTTSYGVQITQPLFRGFRTVSETEAAKKQVMAGRAQLQATEEKLLLDTATSFLDIVRDETVLGLQREYEIILKQKLDETTVRARIGDLTQTDVNQSESRLSRAQVARLQTENTLAADRDAFTHLVGDPPASLAKPTLELVDIADVKQAMRSAEVNNPNVIAARYTLEQSDAQTDLNKGGLLPELDLVGTSSRNRGETSTIPGRYDSSAVLLQLKIPLYDSGTDYANVRASEQTSVQRRMELADEQRHAHELAHNSWEALRTMTDAVKADRYEIDAAAKAREGVKVQSRVGTRTILDLLNAEQELLDAKIDLARSEHDRNLAILQLRSAVGTLTADALKLPLDTYKPEKYYDDNHAKWIGFGGADKDVYAKPDEQEVEQE